MRSVVILLLATSISLHACSVPVFAYALNRWDPDRHVLATARDQAWRDALTDRARECSLNLAVVPGDGADGLEHRALAGPWWTGGLDDERLARLPESPVRRELVRRLTFGQTAVWLFVPGGDAAIDAAARRLLEVRLAYLTGVMRLPEPDPNSMAGSTVMGVEGPVPRLEFSIIDLRRDDADEWVLASQIHAMAPQTKGPCAVPVFGRARALEVLHGSTFNEPMIDDVVHFLCGACSCQVKESNPGWDLLVACDWPQAIAAAATELAQSSASPASQASVQPVPETIITVPRQQTLSPPVFRSWWAFVLGAIAVAGALVLIWLTVRRTHP